MLNNGALIPAAKWATYVENRLNFSKHVLSWPFKIHKLHVNKVLIENLNDRIYINVPNIESTDVVISNSH